MSSLSQCSPWSVLRYDVHRVGVLRVCGDRPDGGRLGEATRQHLPPIIARGHAIEARLDGAAWSGLAREADVYIGWALGRHGMLLRAAGLASRTPCRL